MNFEPEDFTNIIILKHKERVFVGKTGYIIYRCDETGDCEIELDKAVYATNPLGEKEYTNRASVNIKNLQFEKSWAQYTPGLMEDYL